MRRSLQLLIKKEAFDPLIIAALGVSIEWH